MGARCSCGQYPPPQSNEDMICQEKDNKCPGWINLKRDVMVAAHEAGNAIICNSTPLSLGDNFNNGFFKCGLLYHHTRLLLSMKLNDENAYRESFLVNNRNSNGMVHAWVGQNITPLTSS
jgi:hypothetical protein